MNIWCFRSESPTIKRNMYIKSIELKDFRNYENLSLNFDPRVNLILGKNAQGKTNLLEAVYLTSIGKSFRTNRLSELIRFGQDYGKVFVETCREDEEGSVELILSKDSKKSAKIDGVKIKKASELLEHVYLVIFSPEDLKIVKEEPEKRRKFIDRELCQIKPLYYDNLTRYHRILMQRNAYLKETQVEPAVLDIWDRQLAACGSRMMLQRESFIKKINQISSGIHRDITNQKEALKVCYAPNVKLCETEKEQEDFLYQSFQKSLEQDLRQRATTKGPHKDDLEFFINDINVRSFGSQGQQRTTALSLKLAEIHIIKEETGEDPILLLDDVMSELDFERQEFLVKTLSDVQLFITTTEIPDILFQKFPHYRVYQVESGKISASSKR